MNEDRVPVTGCSVTLSGSRKVPLKVLVWTNLATKDKSFGITNVVIQNVAPGRNLADTVAGLALDIASR